MSEEINIKEVYVSIVTLPNLEELEVGNETFNRFKSTYTEHKEYLNDKQVAQSYLDDAGKSVAFNRVYQIALGFEINDTIRVTVLNGEEENIIREFHNLLTSYFSKSKLYGYSNKFIRNVLNFRGRLHKIPLELEASQFKDIKNQAWKQTQSVDLMTEVVDDFRGRISLLNALHGAELSYKGIIPGEDIVSYYKSNKFEEINNSSAATVSGLINLKRFLENKDEIKEYSFGTQEIGKAEKKDINALEHILASGQLSESVIKAIVEFTEEHNLNKENVLTIVKASLSKSKEYQKVNDEDFEVLQEALGLKLDYSVIQCVADKGNLGKEEFSNILSSYLNSKKEKWLEIIVLLEKFLTEKNKINQKNTKKYLDLLKEYFEIPNVLIKGTLGKREVDWLLEKYSESTVEEKNYIIELTSKFLVLTDKASQKRVFEALKLLKTSLLSHYGCRSSDT